MMTSQEKSPLLINCDPSAFIAKILNVKSEYNNGIGPVTRLNIKRVNYVYNILDFILMRSIVFIFSNLVGPYFGGHSL